ncbi:MAG: N-acetylmuramic acid 6-phosphate etherase [Bacteroidota bacterium]|nr:N-acetylmuramic acid 6-phosphate etherase [Bacteroidota bacterium]MDP4228793.1 N-acetylmuramic acid 6-phosphate etherase [Bacteroidota bacterium]MDP4237617.1 N-acetylmuramic acid 6-phosphate etherase [Bacteroidota bacterium]
MAINTLFAELGNLTTEQRNSNSMNLDSMSVKSILELINDEDAKVASVVRNEIPHIEKVVEKLVILLKNGGRLFYVGAGTSGRMGVIDAAECPPTFGTPVAMIQALIAGGNEAVFRSQEGAEDKEDRGALEVALQRVSPKDMVIGIAASKRTPFVLGALKKTFELKSTAVLITTNPRETIDSSYLFESICPVVGPEVLMGSTRMKSAIAQKMILTMITTTTMVRLGKVYENMMVDLQLTNQKLTERAKKIIMLATSCSYEEAAEVLKSSGNHVKTAIVMKKLGLNAIEAKKKVEEAEGFVRRAIS